jgi:hypothetical protein
MLSSKEKRFKVISLSANTAADRVNGLADGVSLKKSVKIL